MNDLPPSEAAYANHDALLAESPWATPAKMRPRIDAVMNENSSFSSKRRKLIMMVDELGAAIHKHSACRAGCSHCCHTAVMIYQTEAEEIALYTCRTVRRQEFRMPQDIKDLGMQTKYIRTPCPFLVEGRCSVYEVRPYACRQQHSLNPTPDQCDTYRHPSNESNVAHFNIKYLELAMAHVMLSKTVPLGDIREFFPG